MITRNTYSRHSLCRRHVDTAQVYRNEADVGAAVLQSGLKREDVFISESSSAPCTGQVLTRSYQLRNALVTTMDTRKRWQVWTNRSPKFLEVRSPLF